MNQERKSLACGGMCGGLIAGLLGLAVARQYELGLWTIVPIALLGGCIGWLACDVAGAKRSVQTARRQVVGWKPDVAWWKCFALSAFAVFILVSSVLFWVALLFATPISWSGAIIISILSSELVCGMTWTLWFCLMSLDNQIDCPYILNLSKVVLVRWNIITLPFSLAWYCGKWTLWLLRKVPSAAKIAGKFLWRVFVLAHSDMRRICFIGSTLGTAIGFYLGYMNGGNLVLWAFLSGVSGAILSVAWREVVAVRWLGLKNV